MAPTKNLQQIDPKHAEIIDKFVKQGIDINQGKAREFPSDPTWAQLAKTGTEIWLDTGDIDGASDLWRSEMSALTTNNTLLFLEVNKGIYDDLVLEAMKILGPDMNQQAAVIELAFILNARHGLRLVEQFGAKVSVELHTDLADDAEGALLYARRFYRLCPESFIIKVPFTPSGLIATRKLRSEGIPVNMTLGFSARQNHIAAMFSSPDFLNVFLGRINACVINNKLGNGNFAGEKATLASQRTLQVVNKLPSRGSRVRQIAASLRSRDQVETLAGVDVHTIPLKVAAGVLESPPATWKNNVDMDLEVGIDDSPEANAARLHVFWEVDEKVQRLARSLDEDPPETAVDLVERAKSEDLAELFPKYSQEELAVIEENKIPALSKWTERIQHREVAADSLLNAAGLLSFTKDQNALDDRIRGLIGR